MLKICLISLSVFCSVSLYSQNNKDEMGVAAKNSAQSQILNVYRFGDQFLDLDLLKMTEVKGKIFNEIKRENSYAPFFSQDENARKTLYKNSVFQLKDDRNISITDQKGNLIKTIADPDKKLLADNVSGNAVLFSVPSGVICAIRLNGENGYHIKKYNEKGEVLKTWKVAHTIFKKGKDYVESIPFIYYFAHTDKEMLFTSMSYSKQQETIILDLENGSEKKTKSSVGGIIADPATNFLAGTINIDKDRKTLNVELRENKFKITDDNYGDAARTVLADSILVIAHYHNIATGCDVNAYDSKSGKLLWKGDVKQLMVAHSKYYNMVHLTLYKGKLILEGNEAQGKYLQVLDLKTGKRLFELMP